MIETIVVSLIVSMAPTLTAIAVLVKLRNDRKAREQDKKEAIEARKLLEKGVAEVHSLVNNKADVQIDTIDSLKSEIARLNRDPGTPTPMIEAGQGQPGEVGIDHGVVTAERKGPFAPPGGHTK